MSTPRVKTDSDSPKSTPTPPVSKSKIMSNPSMVPTRSCFQTTVTVEVGAEKKAFIIHKDLLVFYSDYFRGAFNGSFSESTERKITLADERVDVFSMVNQFIYTRHLSDGPDSDLDWELLIRVWLFGDKYLMPSLQNKVMNVLILKNNKKNVTPTSFLELIYSNTPPGSPLRMFVVDLAAYKFNMALIMTPVEGRRWPHEALFDLVKVMGAKKMEDFGKFALPEENKDRCYYHIHADGKNCDTKL